MKMRPLGCVLCVVTALSFGSPAWAQQDGPPVDLKQLREVLKLIKDKRATDEKLTQTRVLQDFRAAASNNSAAIAFYAQAIQATQFDGKVHEQTAFQDWKRDEGEKLKSDAMQNAVRLHLSYLLLTLQRAMGTPTGQLEPALQAHIAAVIAAGSKDDDIIARRQKAKDNPMLRGKRPGGGSGGDDEPLFWDQQMIKQGVTNSIFVQWYGIQKLVSNLKDWETVPGNIDGINQNTLLPYYRQIKDPKALAIWDAKIQRESQQASSSNLAFKIDQFNKVRLPTLLWSRANDALAIGLRNRGITEMLGVVKNYPDHPELPTWIKRLEEIIMTDDSTDPAASPTASAAPAAPALK